jgi:hypothetical protein
MLFFFLNRGKKGWQKGITTHDVPLQLYFKSEPMRLLLPAVSENLVSVNFILATFVSGLFLVGHSDTFQWHICLVPSLFRGSSSSSNCSPSGRLFRCEFGETRPTANRHPLMSMSSPKASKRHLGVIFLFYSCKSFQKDPVILTSNQCPSRLPTSRPGTT